ncbi:MAG: glycosyltransferase [Clostridioides sp.]|jgi:glycosyltransferase involved in cell wall biosynthesis|nr:glycosyltransferase [Clostridioides sp.]
MDIKEKILIAGTIKDKPEIITEYLDSLKGLTKSKYEVSYYFVDDNVEEESSAILKSFKEEEKNVILVKSDNSDQIETVEQDDFTHIWTYGLIDRITEFKNHIIEYAKENEFDYILFVDSDLYLHPSTLTQLRSDDKDIVSCVFWTRWNADSIELPQVWLQDQYNMYTNGNSIDSSEQIADFLNQMRVPGVYRVGGLGACTLISKHALKKGVNFSKIKNISFWGEDRHFCIRAEALGLELFVDTHNPAYHIYRDSDLEGLNSYKKSF